MPVEETALCPVDGTTFTARSVMSTTYSGEWDMDGTRWTIGAPPLAFYPWTCPRCYFTGDEDDFSAGSSTEPVVFSREMKDAFLTGLKPEYRPAEPKESRDFAPWVRYDLFAQRLKLQSAHPSHIADAYHNAARVIRLITDFPPVEKEYLDTVNERLMKMHKKTDDGTPQWLVVAENLEKLMRKARTPEAGQVALAAHSYHEHGEFPAALAHLRTLRDLPKSPELANWAAETEQEIYREERFMEKAIPYYEAYLQEREDWSLRFLLGDLNRRLGRIDKMEEWFATVKDVPADAPVDVNAFMALSRRLAAGGRDGAAPKGKKAGR